MPNTMDWFGDLGTAAPNCCIAVAIYCLIDYRKISNISRTQNQNLNDFRLIMQFPLPNALKPGFKSRMKVSLEQRRQAMLQLHLSDRQFYCLLRCVLY